MKSILLAGTALIALFVAVPAHAVLHYTLDNSNENNVGPGPYAFMDLTLVTPTAASVVFTGSSVPGFAYSFGEMGLNVNASQYGTSAVASTMASTQNPNPFTVQETGNMDGFGNFNLHVTPDSNGFSSSMSSAQFLILNDSGVWTSEDDVLIPNALGNEVAVHSFLIMANNRGQSSYATGGTGGGQCPEPPCVPDPQSVPEPASMGLLGAGLLGSTAALYWRRRRSES